MTPLVGIIMKSRRNLEIMASAKGTLQALQVPHEVCIVSAHRTPLWMAECAQSAEPRDLRFQTEKNGGDYFF